MAKKWNREEIKRHHTVLYRLYVTQNKSINQIAKELGISDKTVYKRMLILGIQTNRSKKSRYCNQRSDVKIPKTYSRELAEFFGIMLGDGKLSPTQIIVTLGNKEKSYAFYVQKRIHAIFRAYPKIAIRRGGYKDIYLGSVKISRWLKNEGLVYNKVANQVDVPSWILKKKVYKRAFIRGFFDTDGSVYRLRYGIQLSFTNKSAPLLKSLQAMLLELKYQPSSISSSKLYITKKEHVTRFFADIQPANEKHRARFKQLLQQK